MIPDASHELPLDFLAEGAVFLRHTRTLVAADIHLGKSAAFRNRGLPVPEGDSPRDLDRLLDLKQRLDAAEVIIAGDLFHSPGGITPELEGQLRDFLTNLKVPLLLAAGNHDVKLRVLPCDLVPQPFIDRGHIRILHDAEEMMAHETREAHERLHIAGHLHPVVRVREGPRGSLRLPCFLLHRNILILPAFGGFTGGSMIQPKSSDRVFVPLRSRVVEIPPSLWKQRA